MFRHRKVIYTTLLLLLIVSIYFSLSFSLKALQIDAKHEDEAAINKKKYHFALISQELNNPYWRLVGKGAEQAEDDFNVDIEYKGPVQSDIEEHIKIIEMAIASKVDGIFTQGLNTKRFTPVINKAIEKGIPVITIDTDAPKSERIAYVGTDNYRSGYLAGQAMIIDTGGKAVVGIITGSFEETHQQLRVKGFKDAVKEAPGIKIAAIESSHITQVQAAEKANKILVEHPEVNAFFGTSALDGMGIAGAVQRLGRTDDTYILSFDTLPETLQLMREGVIDATVVQKPFMMGYKGVELMVDVLKGKNVPKVTHTKTKVIYPSDLPVHQGLDRKFQR